MSVSAPTPPFGRPHKQRFSLPLTMFLVSLIICSSLAALAIVHRQNLAHSLMKRLLVEKSDTVKDAFGKLLFKTKTLHHLVIGPDGAVKDFERTAKALVDDAIITNVLLAPKGIVTHIYPLAGNERLMGYNLFGPGEGNKEAILARDTGRPIFGGPFNLMQGGRAFVCRLPVFTSGPGEKQDLWGLVSVTLRHPEALRGARLEEIEQVGFGYELWRINPDDNRHQIIASSRLDQAVDPGIEAAVRIMNAEWRLRVMPTHTWYEDVDNLLLLLAAFTTSACFGLIGRNNEQLKQARNTLARLLDTDALTSVLNRNGLFRVLETLIAKGAPFVLYYFDLNHFKFINDTYGHTVGDRVLVTFCNRIEKHLTRRHALARMSGDEFVLIYVPDSVSAEQEQEFWQRVENEFSVPIQSDSGESFLLSYSVGRAVFPDNGKSIDALIHHADTAMYEHKRQYYAKGPKRRVTDGP